MGMKIEEMSRSIAGDAFVEYVLKSGSVAVQKLVKLYLAYVKTLKKKKN